MKDNKVSEIYFAYSEVVSRGTRKMLFSNWFLVFSILIIVISTMLTMFIPALGGSPMFESETYTGIFILTATVTFIVAVSGIMGDLMMDRGSKTALWFYFIYIVLYGTQCYFWALYYEMLQQMIVFVLVLFTLINWKVNKGGEQDTEIKYLPLDKFLYILGGIIVIAIALGLIMDLVINPWIGDNYVSGPDGWPDYELTPWWALRGEDPYPYIDAFALVTFLGAWSLFTRRYYNAYWLMLICILTYFVVYGLMAFQQGVPSYIVYFITNFFYLFLNQTGMSNWTVMYLNQNK